MLPDVELQFRPNIVDCLAWSEDGELAIAAGEFVHILIPQRRSLNTEQERLSSDPWDHVQFRVNTFTYDEWPVRDPAGFDEFSIGEEQSTCTVSALRWSAPGLGKHKRPVLAIQTSNLLVSFWQSNSDPASTSSWQRVLILNNAVQKSWERRSVQEDLPTEDLLRRKGRIRTMAWAPQARQSLKLHDAQFDTRQNFFSLALSNDDDEILILLVTSPYINHLSCWDAKIVKIIRFSDSGPKVDSSAIQARVSLGSEGMEGPNNAGNPHKFARARSSLFKIALEKKRFIHNLAWGPLNLVPNGKTVLTCIRGSAVFHCVISVSFPFPLDSIFSKVPRFRFEYSYLSSDVNQYGGVSKWYSHNPYDESIVVVGDRSQLSVSGWDGSSSTILPCDGGSCRISPHPDRFSSFEARESLSAGQSWDQISGFAYLPNREADSVDLYWSTHLSHIEVIQITKNSQDSNKKTLSCKILPRIPLHRHVLQLRKQYDDQNELGSLSLIKTWGLASFNNYVATCITLHPGDMTEYTIPSQERAIIAFSTHQADNSNSKSGLYPWEINSRIKDCAKCQGTILDTIFKIERQQKYRPDELGNRIIYAAVIAAALVWDMKRLQRLLAAEHAIQRLERSAEIDLTFELEALRLSQRPDLGVDEGIATIKNAINSRHQKENGLLDICPFCAKGIFGESLTEARCDNGHQFVRCNLTFLAIKAPGISKYCDRCNRQYLNEDNFAQNSPKKTEMNIEGLSSIPSIEDLTDISIFDNEMSRTNAKRASLDLEAIKTKPQSLVATLFDTYDTCPYCGGKFLN